MNIQQIRDLALKVLGIYYLANAIISAPQFATLLTPWGKTPEMAGHELATVLSVLLPLVFWIIIGFGLAFRTSLFVALLWPLRPEEPDTTMTVKPSLRFWIVLVAFFYLVGSLGGTVSQLWMIVANQQMRGSFWYYRSLPELSTLVLSIICISKAQAIERFLMTKIGKDSQQSPAGDVAKRAAPEE